MHPFKRMFQGPPGLSFASGTNIPSLKFKEVKARRMKVKSRAKAEKERKDTRKERQKERQREREAKLKRRAKRREEDKKSRAERGEPVVAKTKAKRSSRSHHGAEQVDAVILKLLGKSHKSKGAAGKGKKGVVNKKKVDTIQGTVGMKWKPGMREEAGEGWQLERKMKQKAEAEGSSKKKKTLKPTRTSDIHQAVRFVDIGPDCEADGLHSSCGDRAVELGWPSSGEEAAELASPLPAQNQLDPEAFCMQFFQVKRKQCCIIRL